MAGFEKQNVTRVFKSMWQLSCLIWTLIKPMQAIYLCICMRFSASKRPLSKAAACQLASLMSFASLYLTSVSAIPIDFLAAVRPCPVDDWHGRPLFIICRPQGNLSRTGALHRQHEHTPHSSALESYTASSLKMFDRMSWAMLPIIKTTIGL